MKAKINYAVFLFIITLTSGFAQVKSITPGQDFTSIKVSTGLFVDILTGAEEKKIDIKGSARDKVNVEVDDGELQLSLPVGQLFTEAEILITVYTDKVEELKVRSGSEVEFNTIVDQKELRLIASEGSYIGGELKLNTLSVKSVTGSSVSVVGFADTTSVEVKTGGSYDGEGLTTETTSVSISYGGEATVHATDTCSANVTAGGSIEINGNPSTLSQKTKLGGNIKVIE